MARFLVQILLLELILLATVSGLFKSNKIQGTKYKLQQKVLTLGSSYTIKDDKDKPVYKVMIETLSYIEKQCSTFFRLDLNN